MKKIICLLIALIGHLPIGLYAQRTCGSDLNASAIDTIFHCGELGETYNVGEITSGKISI